MENLSYERVFREILSLKDEYIEFWREFCDIESPTSSKAGVDAACEYVINKARAKGWDIEVFLQDVSGNPVLITVNPDAKGKTVALSGHVDTVQPIGLFGYPPTRIDGEYIYGPGVCDCKGGIVAAFLAMDALCRCGYKGRPIKLLLQTDEEVSSRFSGKATINWICERASDAVAFLNLEPYEPGYVIVKRKGILRYEFTVYGNSAHSSACADNKGEVSAIAEAAHKIIELEKLKNPDGLTCNCGVIKGGSVANTVPAECSFVVDIRFSNQAELEEAERIVSEVASRQYVKGSRCKLERLSCRVAMEEREENYQLVARMNEIFLDAGLSALIPRGTKSGSDAADVTAYGITTVDCIGVDGLDRIHSPEEKSHLSSLIESAKRISAVILKI